VEIALWCRCPSALCPLSKYSQCSKLAYICCLCLLRRAICPFDEMPMGDKHNPPCLLSTKSVPKWWLSVHSYKVSGPILAAVLPGCYLSHPASKQLLDDPMECPTRTGLLFFGFNASVRIAPTRQLMSIYSPISRGRVSTRAYCHSLSTISLKAAEITAEH
jgi:hypothetical protein